MLGHRIRGADHDWGVECVQDLCRRVGLVGPAELDASDLPVGFVEPVLLEVDRALVGCDDRRNGVVAHREQRGIDIKKRQSGFGWLR